MAVRRELEGWLAGRLPDGWFVEPPAISHDADEILVIGRLEMPSTGSDGGEEAQRAAARGRIKRFREETREQRMRIADETERAFGRKVAWGASAGEVTEIFTSLALPVMTRLRLRERAVLDTLISAGVARSRSDALAWCVRLVAQNKSEWIDELREAIEAVKRVRDQGPAA